MNSSSSYLPTLSDAIHLLHSFQQLIGTWRTQDPIHLYRHFCELEEEYTVQKDATKSYCHDVHKLYPVIYYNDLMSLRSLESRRKEDSVKGLASLEEESEELMYKQNHTIFQYPLRSVFKCPYCKEFLTDEQRYYVHILNKSQSCMKCSLGITYEKIAVQRVIERYNSDKASLLKNYQNIEVSWFPDSLNPQEIHSWRDFAIGLTNRLPDTISSKHPWEIRDIIRSIITKYRPNLSSIGLDLVKAMYRELVFWTCLVRQEGYWTNESVFQTALNRYEHYQQLLSHNPDQSFLPTIDIEFLWRVHLMKPMQYFQYTQTLKNRNFLDHPIFPVTYPIRSMHYYYTNTTIYWMKHYREVYSLQYPASYDLWIAGEEEENNWLENKKEMNDEEEKESILDEWIRRCCCCYNLYHRWVRWYLWRDYQYQLATITSHQHSAVKDSFGVTNPLQPIIVDCGGLCDRVSAESRIGSPWIPSLYFTTIPTISNSSSNTSNRTDPAVQQRGRDMIEEGVGNGEWTEWMERIEMIHYHLDEQENDSQFIISPFP
jgi:hypothetical protein